MVAEGLPARPRRRDLRAEEGDRADQRGGGDDRDEPAAGASAGPRRRGRSRPPRRRRRHCCMAIAPPSGTSRRAKPRRPRDPAGPRQRSPGEADRGAGDQQHRRQRPGLDDRRRRCRSSAGPGGRSRSEATVVSSAAGARAPAGRPAARIAPGSQATPRTIAGRGRSTPAAVSAATAIDRRQPRSGRCRGRPTRPPGRRRASRISAAASPQRGSGRGGANHPSPKAASSSGTTPGGSRPGPGRGEGRGLRRPDVDRRRARRRAPPWRRAPRRPASRRCTAGQPSATFSTGIGSRSPGRSTRQPPARGQAVDLTRRRAQRPVDRPVGGRAGEVDDDQRHARAAR